MAMTTQPRGRAISGINVTPMADIMIVLLIIFMVMTPLIDRGHVRSLPKAAHSRERPEAARTLSVSIAVDGATWLGQRRLGDVAELRPALEAVLTGAAETERVVFVKADESLAYSQVQKVLDACRAAGAEEVALVSRRKIGG